VRCSAKAFQAAVVGLALLWTQAAHAAFISFIEGNEGEPVQIQSNLEFVLLQSGPEFAAAYYTTLVFSGGGGGTATGYLLEDATTGEVSDFVRIDWTIHPFNFITSILQFEIFATFFSDGGPIPLGFLEPGQTGLVEDGTLQELTSYMRGEMPPNGLQVFVQSDAPESSPNYVPEPGTLGLFGAGLTGWLMARRRKTSRVHGRLGVTL
jgi:hypothetical protein